MTRTNSLAVLLLLAATTAVDAFVLHRHQQIPTQTRTQKVRRIQSRISNQKEDQDLQQAEDDAAFDAHDCSDPGMEAAAEERAVMMAHELGMGHVKHEIHAEQTNETTEEKEAEEVPSSPRLTLEEVDAAEMEQAEQDAAYDSHDCPDAGMEAAAEERAVMLAYEMAEKKKAEARGEKGS